MERSKTENLKIVFFGLGSIGKRHARLIKDNFNFELFSYRTGKGQEKNNLKIQEVYSLDEVFLKNPDIAFITNPTHLHVDTALECTKRNINLFIEKPISHSLENIDKLEGQIRDNKIFSYVAYNLRFHPVIEKLKELITEIQNPVNFDVSCRSYLPNWRPNQDYSKSYSAKKELGGGVILDLSHEFDYINWLFGDITRIEGEYDKVSNLKIDCEDNLDAKITCNNNQGLLHLDTHTQNEERRIEIYYEDVIIKANLINNTLKVDGKKSDFKINPDTTYIKQLDYFFTQFHNKNYNIMNNFREASKTFKKIMDFKKEKCLV